MKRVAIVAEAGVNHNGSIDRAKLMVEAAADAGADIVKFQTFNSTKVVTRYAEKAEYQARTTKQNESQLEMMRRLELTKAEHRILVDYCRKKRIQFLSTAFDLDSLRFLCSLKMPFIKIPSGEITNYPYLREVAKIKKPVVMSTGMATLGEIEEAIGVLEQFGLHRELLTLLQCNTEYPSPYDDVNLAAMITMGQAFCVSVGYSDHTLGIEIPIAAVALGATLIEKHFTLDRNMEGPDHNASLMPDELRAMVRAIRHVEQAIGVAFKHPTESERKNIAVARKSIVASRPIKENDTFSETNVTTKRPGSGISPMQWEEIVGKKARRDFKEDELIEP